MTDPEAARENGWSAGWRVARFYPHRYVPGGVLWALVALLPLFPGLLLKVAFDRVADEDGSNRSAMSVLAVLAGVEITRSATLWSAITAWTRWWSTVGTWLRGNILRAVLLGDGPPAGRLPGTPGEAVGRFRDDVDDVIWLTDGWVDLAGALVLGVVGVGIMAAIDPLLTLIAVTPLVAIVFVTRILGNRVRKIHRSLRESGSTVTAFVADMFTNAATLKTSGAADRAVARFHSLNVARGDAAVRAHVTNMFVYNVGVGAASISTGLVLLLAASAMRRNEFTVGDLALFTSYASSLTFLPRRTGETIARARAAGVSTERLARLVPESGVEGVFAAAAVDVTQRAEPAPASTQSPTDALRLLSIRGLTASPAPQRRGVVDVDLDIAAGEFVVITGAVGAGKTTLLRALLGFVPCEAGTIEWNGVRLTDPGLELVAPRVAYVAQVPRLFSAALGENITLGWHTSPADVADAIRAACLTDDISAMPDALDTMVGPRGMRLSGGQAQRTAAARALVRRPNLLVVDDLSSALDPHTESALWDALAALPTACLAVSHRPAVLERADRIVTLVDGRRRDQLRTR